MKISKAKLKKLAKNYRKTKKYPMLATIAEYEYLQTQWKLIENQIRTENTIFDLETCVALTIGSWQVANGFILTHAQVIRDFDKKAKK